MEKNQNPAKIYPRICMTHQVNITTSATRKTLVPTIVLVLARAELGKPLVAMLSDAD